MARDTYQDEKSNLHKGHRARVKAQFRRHGFDTFSDVQILEMALFFGVPQGDTNGLAHRLINQFGSLSAVFDAPISQLLEVDGVGENTATLLSALVPLCRAYRLDKIADDNVFETTEKIGRYLLAYFMGAQTERAVVLCFDSKHRLIDTQPVASDGLSTMTEAKTRRIAELALSHHAHAVVLAHNHPSGIVEPSEYDLTYTNALDFALAGVGVHLLEHFIVTDEEYLPVKAYIRDNGYTMA